MPEELRAELLAAPDGQTRERILRRELAFAAGRLQALAELAGRTQAPGANATSFRILVAGVLLAAGKLTPSTGGSPPN
jgi:hypothetical protein